MEDIPIPASKESAAQSKVEACGEMELFFKSAHSNGFDLHFPSSCAGLRRCVHTYCVLIWFPGKHVYVHV